MEIFLIEDDILWRTKLLIIAEEIGLNITGIAENLADSRKFLSSNVPNLIIADVMLGDEKIFDLFADGQFVNIPVLFITLSIDPTNYKQAKGLKKSHFLVKPFHQLSLQAAVDVLMEDYIKATLDPQVLGIMVRGKYNEKITLPPAQIIWVKQDRNYCFIKTASQQYALKTSLSNVSKYLGSGFIQVNRACILNKTANMRIDMSTKQLKVNNELLPIGRKFKEEILKQIGENKRN